MLPTPGSPDYTPALIEALEGEPSLLGWELDGTLVAVLLLALIVRRGGVIIDVPSGRKAYAGSMRAVRTATAIMESVFGLETQTLALDSESTTASVKIGGDALVVTGLEDVSPAVLVKVRTLMTKPDAPFLIWVRDEDRDDAPMWLIDLFSCSTPLGEFDLPPDGLERNALIPEEYIDDLNALLCLSHIHPPLELHISNLVAAAELHPQLVASISQSGTFALNDMVRGQRLLAGSFNLPQGWRGELDAWRRHHANTAVSPLGISNAGFAGGPGGVSTWGARAGEAPKASAMLGDGAEDWYCTPENVAGAWELAVRHRLRVREPGETALYALNSSALERTEQARKEQTTRSRRENARRKRAVLDEALEQMLVSV